MATALEGVRVLDLSRGPVGGLATMILADFGAEVVKVEPLDGDPYRRLAAAPMWLRGKQSLALDLTTEEGAATLKDLARFADVVVVALSNDAVTKLGVDYDALRSLNPALIYCSITGFGPAGQYSSYPAYEGLVAAKSGRMMSFQGQRPRPGPAFAAVPVGSYSAAHAAVQGILASLLVRSETGAGQRVETSLLQGMLPYDMAGLATHQLMRSHPDQFPTDPLASYNRQPTLQYQPVLTEDGRWLQLGNLVEHLFHAFIAAADLSEIYEDPRFAGAPRLDESAREALRTIIIERMRERPLDQWMQRFIEDGNVAAEPIVRSQEALKHPQLRHNGDVIEVTTRGHGRMLQLGPIATLRNTPAQIEPDAPDIGQHDPMLARRWATAGVTVRHKSSERPANAPPLEGVTVVEIATIIAAPLACAMLGDLGARVIKIEAPPDGDPLRSLGNGVSASKTTASKESICIDLKSADGREIAQALIARADVLVHNLRPGVPERLGFGYDQVRARNPAIVYVSAMGYGVDGPAAHRPSAHPVAGAATGGALWQAGAGWPGQVDTTEQIKEAARAFTRANEVNPDPTTSMAIVTAALLGLYARKLHGRGQRVDLNMFVANAYANIDDFVWYAGKSARAEVDENLYGLSALYRLYQAREGWVFLAALTDAEWRALCRTAGWLDLGGDHRFDSIAQRRSHDAELSGLLCERFCEQGADDWERLLTAAGVGCVRADGPMPGAFWAEDAHVRECGFVREVEHPRWGQMLRHGPVVTLGDTPPRPGPGTIAGQHTDSLLQELSYDAGVIAQLRSTRVVAGLATGAD